jgi:hypothetical protein
MQFRPLSEGIQYTSKLDKRLESPELYIFRFGPKAKVELDVPNDAGLHTIIILACPPKPAGLDMRIAGHLAEIIGGEGFENRWLEATSEAELNDVLVRDDHFLHLNVEDVALLSGQLGRPLSEVELPDQVNIVLIERGAEMLYANPSLTLQAGDIVAIIGEPEALTDLQAKSQKPS